MTPTRRGILAAGLAVVVSPRASFPAQQLPRAPLGLVIHSFPARTAGDRDRRPEDRFAEPMRFLDHARSLGAAGIQVGFGDRPDAYADAIRDRAEAASIWLEGIASPPRDEADLPRFEAEI